MTGTTTWKELRPKLVKPEDEARIAQAREAMVAELHLAGLRTHRKASQADVAERMSVSQANVSQIEHGDVKLSTLAGYVDALGGKLEVHAVFKDERVPLSGSGKNDKKNGQLGGSRKGTADKDPSKNGPIRGIKNEDFSSSFYVSIPQTLDTQISTLAPADRAASNLAVSAA